MLPISKVKVSTAWLIAVCVVAGLLGSALAVTTAPAIYSNVASVQIYLPNTTNGIILSALGTIAINQTFTLVATLNPLPTLNQLQQNITCYITSVVGANSATPYTGNLTTGLSYIYNSYAESTNATVNGVAQFSLTLTVPGSYYFIAEIASPM